MPNEQEVAAISNFAGDVSALKPPERFFLAIKDVPEFSARINALIFKCTAADSIREMEHKLE